MTLAAIATELRDLGITNADVHIAVGLPLTWVEQQRREFKKYLMQNETVDFTYKGIGYNIRIVGADIFRQLQISCMSFVVSICCAISATAQ